jgi:hypothetical protein
MPTKEEIVAKILQTNSNLSKEVLEESILKKG